jgi:DHA3 family macrolide efflux protein-like MFS transporter
MTDFFIIWIGQAFSIVGSELVQFALIWWLTDSTGSATVLTMALVVGKLPRILLGPLAGTLVDRWKRRTTMLVADSAIALATLGLSWLFATAQVQVWQVYALMFVRSLGACFHGPAMSASTSLMVPKEHLPRIQGINQLLNGGVSIVAAPLGALLLAWLPMQGVLMIDVSTALMAILPLLFISVPQPERRLASASGEESFWADFTVGVRYVRGWPGLMAIAIIAAVGNLLLNPTLMLLPVLVTKRFGGGVAEVGWGEAAFSLGVVIGSAVLGVWGGTRRLIITMLAAVLALGASMLAAGVVPPSAFVLLLATMLSVGIALPMFNGPLRAIMQRVVEPEIQGRVFTLFSSVTLAMTPLGAIIVGPVADRLGIAVCYVATGVVLIAMGVGAFFVPAVMQIEEQESERG